MTVDDSVVIQDALAEHYRTNGLPSDGGASDPWFRVMMGPLTLRLPNPPARRRAVRLHDINHLVTSYNTVFSEGEMAIAAFEVGAGCGRYLLVWLINLSMFALGLAVQPRVEFGAFMRGRRSTSIYRIDRDVSVFDALTITDARELLHLDDVNSGHGFVDVMSFVGWAVAAMFIWLLPVVVVIRFIVP